MSGPRRSEESFVPFNNMLELCELVELQSFGDSFTWGGIRGTPSIHNKLDMAFGNKNWFNMFPASNQSFLDKRGSDHRPVLVRLVSSPETFKGSFRFYARFLNKPMVKEEIKKAWLTNHPFFGASVSDRLKRCRKALSTWKKTRLLNSRDNIVLIQFELEKEQSSRALSTVRIDYLKRELVKAYREEEKFWSQRCKEKWSSKGDRNTKFFHASVKANRARKHITKLNDRSGRAQSSEAAKGEVASQYFQELFRSLNPDTFDDFFHGFRTRIAQSMNDQITREVSREEVKEAVFAIKPASAP